jgi:porphobilinogen synthase
LTSKKSPPILQPLESNVLKKAGLDIQEVADIIMVKPSPSYLDIIRAVRDELNIPIGAYNVSGNIP